MHVNTQRVKSARAIQIGDELEITRNQFQIIVNVKALSEKRGPAKDAQLLYEETRQSIEAREIKQQQRKLLDASMPTSRGKPNKHQRKKIRQASGKL